MPGYVYIMRRNRKDRHGKVTFQRQYKIGISKKVYRRHRTINRAVPGGARLVTSKFFLYPERIENRLHEIFADSRHNLKRAGKGAGKTEWFYLSIVELVLLRLWLGWFYVRISVAIVFVIVLIYFNFR